jgi:hypothetical protein
MLEPLAWASSLARARREEASDDEANTSAVVRGRHDLCVLARSLLTI